MVNIYFLLFLMLTFLSSLQLTIQLLFICLNWDAEVLIFSLIGENSQTHNHHLLRHLTYFVRLFGPLWVYSCFGFEALNGFLNTMIHGTQHISNQVNVYLKCNYCFHSVSSLCIYLLRSRNDGNNILFFFRLPQLWQYFEIFLPLLLRWNHQLIQRWWYLLPNTFLEKNPCKCCTQEFN